MTRRRESTSVPLNTTVNPEDAGIGYSDDRLAHCPTPSNRQ